MQTKGLDQSNPLKLLASSARNYLKDEWRAEHGRRRIPVAVQELGLGRLGRRAYVLRILFGDSRSDTLGRLGTELPDATPERLEDALDAVEDACPLGDQRPRRPGGYEDATRTAPASDAGDPELRPLAAERLRGMLRRLASLLDTLDPKGREALLASELDGLPMNEIAAALAGDGALRKPLYRAKDAARGKLREALAAEGITAESLAEAWEAVGRGPALGLLKEALEQVPRHGIQAAGPSPPKRDDRDEAPP